MSYDFTTKILQDEFISHLYYIVGVFKNCNFSV